mgnify:CR=1 FL=1
MRYLVSTPLGSRGLCQDRRTCVGPVSDIVNCCTGPGAKKESLSLNMMIYLLDTVTYHSVKPEIKKNVQVNIQYSIH